MEKLNLILEKFKIPKANYEFKTISNGLINDTYLVSKDESPTYIFQRINTKVFVNVSSLTHNLELVLPLLKGENYQSIALVDSKNGKSFYESGNEDIWRLMTFIPNSVVFNNAPNTKVAFEAGKVIGLFHSLLSDFDVSKLEDTLPKFHSIAFRYEQFNTVIENAKETTLKNSAKAITFVRENINELLKIDPSALPVRVCHNDTKLNNILFSTDENALCLIDLDTIMRGTFLYDFGDAVRTIANTEAEDEKDLSKINFIPELFEAFIDGLAENKNLLTAKEKELLPLGAAMIPFIHGLRALTDYLDNNRYYKVSYETQNLDRCLSLFKFAELTLQNQAYMKEVIANRLG